MKKVRLLLLIFAATLVAQTINAQVVHDEWVIPLDNQLIWCLDENVTGDLVYAVKYKVDKEGTLVRFSMHNKGGFLIGETGTRYKVIDIFNERYGVPPEEAEYMFVGIYKIIAPGEGKVFEGRIFIHIDVDKNGELMVKKYIVDMC
ncbi:MAG: hypothetical protein U9R49_03400 [Bacteroidota bacterium]|nr:hypothetical protein [Bacteroidota bacterium]